MSLSGLQIKNSFNFQLSGLQNVKLSHNSFTHNKLSSQLNSAAETSPSTTLGTPYDLLSSPKTSCLRPKGSKLGDDDDDILSASPLKILGGRSNTHQFSLQVGNMISGESLTKTPSPGNVRKQLKNFLDP